MLSDKYAVQGSAIRTSDKVELGGGGKGTVEEESRKCQTGRQRFSREEVEGRRTRPTYSQTSVSSAADSSVSISIPGLCVCIDVDVAACVDIDGNVVVDVGNSGGGG